MILAAAYGALTIRVSAAQHKQHLQSFFGKPSPEHAQLIRLFVEMVQESSTLAVLLVCSRRLLVLAHFWNNSRALEYFRTYPPSFKWKLSMSTFHASWMLL